MKLRYLFTKLRNIEVSSINGDENFLSQMYCSIMTTNIEVSSINGDENHLLMSDRCHLNQNIEVSSINGDELEYRAAYYICQIYIF